MKRARFVQAAALAVAVSFASLAAGAQQAGHEMPGAESESGQAYQDAMQTMMDDMAEMAMTGDASVDFAMMMIPHHQSAIDMAEAYLEYGDDLELSQLANQIIADQHREIEFLEAWLEANR